MAISETKARAAGKPVARGDHIYLIDGSGYIFRAYHALPPLTRPSDGLPVGAHLMAPALAEGDLFRAAAVLEGARP